MATMKLQKPPAPEACWSWSVELEGDADACRFRLQRDGLLLLSGSIAALDGATTAELHDQRIGETPHDVAEIHDAWQWALNCCRELMLGLDGYVDWKPHPDPRRGWGEGPA
jgi:hypothetical protein